MYPMFLAVGGYCDRRHRIREFQNVFLDGDDLTR